MARSESHSYRDISCFRLPRSDVFAFRLSSRRLRGGFPDGRTFSEKTSPDRSECFDRSTIRSLVSNLVVDISAETSSTRAISRFDFGRSLSFAV